MMECIELNCKEKAELRGLCSKHHRVLERVVKDWTNTMLWSDFEKQGRCLPKGGMSKNSIFKNKK